MDSHSDDVGEFWKALNMCFILLELTENKNTKSCDIPSINDFLEDVTTFMADITFVVNPFFLCCVFNCVFVENRTQDMSELCEYAKSLTTRCQKLMNTEELQPNPQHVSTEAEAAS